MPIVLAYMDYERKLSGLGPVFTPTGDVERDMAEIKRFYAAVQGPARRQLRGRLSAASAGARQAASARHFVAHRAQRSGVGTSFTAG